MVDKYFFQLFYLWYLLLYYVLLFIRLSRGINDTYPTNFEWDKNFITSRIFITALSGINEFHYVTQWEK
jgi:hypothetical protein